MLIQLNIDRFPCDQIFKFYGKNFDQFISCQQTKDDYIKKNNSYQLKKEIYLMSCSSFEYKFLMKNNEVVQSNPNEEKNSSNDQENIEDTQGCFDIRSKLNKL